MVFLISVRIVLYRHGKFGHHLGTKASKTIVFISVIMSEKSCICNSFHRSSLLDSTKRNTIFYDSIFCGGLHSGVEDHTADDDSAADDLHNARDLVEEKYGEHGGDHGFTQLGS